MPPKKKPVTVASYYTKPGQKKKVNKKVVQNYNRKTGTQQRVRDTKNAGSLLASYRWGITQAAYKKRVTDAQKAALQKARKKRKGMGTSSTSCHDDKHLSMAYALS